MAFALGRWHQAALGFVVALLPTSACVEEQRCGDGTKDPAEACDDGNTASSDGCSSTCELDDDAATPGDDRAGYVRCPPPTPGDPDIVCGPGLGCCAEGFCAESSQECQSPFGFVSCDGDEDCPSPDTHCWIYKTTGCTSDWGYSLACHDDADCPGPVFECRSGSCPLFSDPP